LARTRGYPELPSALEPGQHSYTTTIRVEIAPGVCEYFTLSYLLYVPAAYSPDGDGKWPLVLFLHGSGERGDDLALLKAQPLPKLLEERADFPALVVSPQLGPERKRWSDLLDPACALVDQIAGAHAVDGRRLYATGLSLGGFGVWELALCSSRQRFAAIVPIAGGWREGSRDVPEGISELRGLPVWAFHGALDETVPAYQSEVLVEALRARGGDVRFTLYPDADHVESWLRAYTDPELYEWLFAQVLAG
jgi:predicted peptidase